jgi:hypothetical protein
MPSGSEVLSQHASTVDLQPRRPACASASAQEILEQLLPEALRVAGEGQRRVIAELTVPVSRERADLAVVGEQIWCYEIKSARDSLRRLQRQISAFERVAHRCVLVAATRHLPLAASQVGEHWGLLEAPEDDSPLRWHRTPEVNTELDRKMLLRLLWREEAESALRQVDGEPRPGRRHRSLLGEIWRTLDADSIEACVRQALLRRTPYEGRIAAHALVG